METAKEILISLEKLDSASKVVAYWEQNQSEISSAISANKEDIDVNVKLMYLLVESMNSLSKYTLVTHFYKTSFREIKDDLISSENILELKFEFAKGFYFSKHYEMAKNLFDDLASNGYVISRFGQWWDHSAYKVIKDKVWLREKVLFISVFIPLIIIIFWLHNSFGSGLVFTSITMLCVLIAILSTNNLTTKWYLEELDATINSKQYLPNLTEKTLLLLGVEGIALLVHYFQEHFVYIIAFLIIPLAFLIKRKIKRKSLPDLIGELNRKKILGT